MKKFWGNRFSLYFCADTRLFVTFEFWDNDFTENVIYQKIVSDKLSANLGYEYENLVAQMLTATGKRYLMYTKDYKKDGATILLPVYMTPLL